MKIFVLFLLVTTGCAARQTPASGMKFIETRNVASLEIKRLTDDGQSVPVTSAKFATPVTVVRGSCYYGADCLMWPSNQGMVTKVIQDGWIVILVEESTITIAK